MFLELYHDTKISSKIKSDVFLMYNILNTHLYVRMSIYVLIILLTNTYIHVANYQFLS